jgi:hypothetical protein
MTWTEVVNNVEMLNADVSYSRSRGLWKAGTYWCASKRKPTLQEAIQDLIDRLADLHGQAN